MSCSQAAATKSGAHSGWTARVRYSARRATAWLRGTLSARHLRMSPRCWLRNGLELDHLRRGKCDTQHLGPEVDEHCRIAVVGADHGTEAVPIMADSIAYGVARHNCDSWRLVEGTSWEGPRGARAARSHASSVRPLGRAGAPLLRLW